MVITRQTPPPVPWRITWRGCWRLVILLGVGVTGILAYGWRPENRRTVAGRARWLQTTCRRALRVLHVRMRVDGAVSSGVMWTPNHMSYLDVLVLASLAPAAFVSKAEVAGWPLFGGMARMAGTLFLRRERKSDLVRVGEQVGSVLAAGVNVVVFLEGTSTDGQQVLRFRPGLLQPVVAGGHRVAPVTLCYRIPSGHDVARKVAWWGRMPLVRHAVNLLGLSWIDAQVTVGAPRHAGTNRKALAEELHQLVAVQLAKSRRTHS